MKGIISVALGAALFATTSASVEELESLQGRIKHVIVLMEENRSFDHLFGFAGDLLGVNGLTGDETNPISTTNASADHVRVKNLTSYLNPCDPGHTTWATTSKIFGADAVARGDLSNPNMQGFIEWQELQGDGAEKDYCGVMSMFTPDKLPILTTLAQEFAIMDRFFCDHPGPTWPNRLYALSGTNAGNGETYLWYKMQLGKLFPQKTIFDQVQEGGLEWRNYYNDTPWEAFVETIAHNPDNVRSMADFYKDAKEGTLPSYAWINPRSGINMTTGVGSNDQHPDHDMAAGERYYKDIYEALRASPQWNETLFIITYDEHGGFYDHVPPPSAPIPDDEPTYPDPYFKRNRLGVRIPTLLISPWIKKGTVVSAPPQRQKPQTDSEYSLSSILSTARLLLNITHLGPLTKRDAWAATFEHVLLDPSFSAPEPRTDCPQHLPEPPAVSIPPHVEAAQPLNDLQKEIASVHTVLSGSMSVVESALESATSALPPSELPFTQGEISEFLKAHYEEHRNRTKEWIESKAMKSPVASDSTIANRATSASSIGKSKLKWPFGYVVRCGPVTSIWAETGWKVTQATQKQTKTPDSTGASMQNHSMFATVSSKHVARRGTPFCLDANTATQGDKVKASVCYPSVNPDENRDSMQKWVVNSVKFGDDGTIRPYANDSLCVTNKEYEGSFRVYLEPCVDAVTQKWGWHGGAPGNDHSGHFYFGDGTNALSLFWAI